MAMRLKPVTAAVASALVIGLAATPSAIGQTMGNSSTSSNAQTSNQPATDSQNRVQYGNQAIPAATETNATQRAQNMQSEKRTSAEQGKQVVDMRASRIIGKDISNAQGKELGEIEDLVVDLNSNRIRYAVLTRGGVLGIGDKEYAVPLSRFNVSPYGRLTLNMTEQEIKNAPNIDRSAADWNNPSTWNNVGQYYHRTLGMPGDTAGASQRFQWASDLVGMDVVGANKDDVGEIQDLVVNLKSGDIHYAVLQFDRAWSLNNNLVALPMSSFHLTNDGDQLAVNLTREQLASAPSFNRRDWPNMADTGFRNRVAGFGANRNTVGMEQQSAPTALIIVIDEPQYSRLDTNRDGRLSRQEVKSISELDRQWSQIDRDNDGFLTRDELRQWGNETQNNVARSGTSSNATTSSGVNPAGSSTNPSGTSSTPR